MEESVDHESHHLPEDFGVFGPGEGPVRDPACHEPLVRVSSRPLHLGHHGLLLLLLPGTNIQAVIFITTSWEFSSISEP